MCYASLGWGFVRKHHRAASRYLGWFWDDQLRKQLLRNSDMKYEEKEAIAYLLNVAEIGRGGQRRLIGSWTCPRSGAACGGG